MGSYGGPYKIGLQGSLFDRSRGKPWEALVIEDFAEMQKAGLSHPLMDEIEKRFETGG